MICLKSTPPRASASAVHADATRQSRSQLMAALAALAGTVCLGGIHANAHAALVTMNTSSLQGQAARLDFSLLDGDGVDGNNSFTISSFFTDGTLGGNDCTLSCTGGPPFTITDAGGLGQFLQDLTLGTTLSFEIGFTRNFSGNGAPDRTSLLLLDAGNNFTLVDSNLDFANDPVPVQDALLVVDHAPGVALQVATVTAPNIPIAVDEPNAAALVSLALGPLVLLNGRRIRRRSAYVSRGAVAAATDSQSPSTDTRPGEST